MVIKYLTLALTIFFFSCKSQNVEIADKLKESFIFYEHNDSFIKTKSGLISLTRKLYSNKDTLCSSIFKSENILFKTDFNGKILWQRIIENSLPEYALEVENGDLYNFKEKGKGAYLIGMDSLLNEKSSIRIKFGVPANDIFWHSFKYINNGKFFGFGSYILNERTITGQETYKQVFCILDKDKGLEKFVIDDEVFENDYRFKFEVSTDGSIYGLAIYGDYNAKNTTLKLRKYNSAFKLKFSKNTVYEGSSSIDYNNVILKNNQVNILFAEKNRIKFLNFNKKLKRKDADLGPVSNFFPKFVDNGNDKDLLFGGDNFLAKITQNQNTFIRTDLIILDNYYNHNFIGINNNFYSIYNSGKHYKPQITFYAYKVENSIIKKTLFKSEFERSCYVK